MLRIVHARCFSGQSFRRLRALALACSLVWFSGAASFGCLAFSQTSTASKPAATTAPKPATSTAKTVPTRHTVRHRKHPRKLRHSTKTVVVPPTAPPAPVVPAAPVYPIPPEQQPAVPAHILYDGHQLTIEAKNASLAQILAAVWQKTGMTVSGLNGDMRVYGSYGPGTVNQTLTALLNGCPYIFVMIGGDATHPAKQLQLSLSNGAQ